MDDLCNLIITNVTWESDLVFLLKKIKKTNNNNNLALSDSLEKTHLVQLFSKDTDTFPPPKKIRYLKKLNGPVTVVYLSFGLLIAGR